MPARSRRASVRRADPAGDPAIVAGQVVLAAKLALMLLLFDPAASDAFALPKAVVGRALSVALIAPLVILVLRYGIGALRWGWIQSLALTYVAISALATALAQDRALALFGAPIRQLGLLTIVDLALVLVATAALVRTQPDLRRAALVVLGTALPVLFYAAIQVVGRDPIRWGEPPITSTLGNPAHVGAHLAVVAVIAMGIMATFWAALRPWSRAGLGVFAAACALVLGPVGSRAPLLALVVGVGVAITLALVRQRRIPLSAVGLGVVIVVGGVGVSLALPLGERFRTLLSAGDPSRELLWTAALQMIASHPILGLGPDGFAAAYPALRTVRAIQVVGVNFLESSPHSWILQAAVGSGVVGAAALLCLTVFAMYRAARLVPAAPHVVPLLAGITTFLVQAVVAPDQIALDMLFWIGLGLVVSVGHLPSVDERVGSTTQRGLTTRSLGLLDGLLAIGVVAAVAVAAVSWSGVRASELHVAAVANVSAGNAQEGLRLARLSVDMDGGRAQYWAGLGQAELATAQPQRALISFERAASLAPYLSGHWRNVASTRLQLASTAPDQLPRALQAARRAVDAQPSDPFAYQVLARVLLEQGDREGAIREARRALSMYAAIPEAYQVIGVAYAQTAQYADAEKIAREGVEATNDPELHLLLARVLIVTGRKAEAAPHVQFVLDRFPKDAEALELAALLK